MPWTRQIHAYRHTSKCMPLSSSQPALLLSSLLCSCGHWNLQSLIFTGIPTELTAYLTLTGIPTELTTYLTLTGIPTELTTYLTLTGIPTELTAYLTLTGIPTELTAYPVPPAEWAQQVQSCSLTDFTGLPELLCYVCVCG